MIKLRKVFTAAVVVLTITWAVGLAAFVPVAQAATLMSGDLIKASLPAVYYYGADGERYVFPNEKTYKSWYSDFSGVKTITDSELAAIPIGGNVTSRPGVKMLKINTDPKVYAVSQNGTLHWVPTEAIATCIYGSAWASMVDDVSDAFFVNYTSGSDITDCSDYNKQDAMNASPDINTDKGLGGGGSGGGLMISLASDSPSPASVPGGAASAATDVVFAKIKLSNSGAPVNISKLRITRTGLSADTDLTAVKIWDGATQLDTAQTLNSSHQALFNVNRTLNSDLIITVTGDLALGTGNSSAEIKLGVASNTDVISDASSTTGAPVWGSTQTAVNTNVGSLTIATGGSMPAALSTVDLEQTETFFAMRLTAGSVEDVQINSITFKAGNASTINVGDIDEIVVINDTTGDTIASGVMQDANGDLVINLSTPLVLAKGNTRDIIVRAKVVDGAGRVVAFDINDGVSWLIRATGKTYGFGVAFTNAWTGTAGIGTGTTINQGTVTISKAPTSPAAGNIPIGGTDINVGEFKFDLKGEDVRFGTTVVTLTVVSVVAGNCTNIIDNIKLVDGSGDVLAGPVSPTGTIAGGTCTATFSSSYELPNGENTVAVLINTTSSIVAGNTVLANIPTGSFANVRGMTSNRTITPAPAATTITANIQTVKGPALVGEMGATPIAGNVVAGKTAMWIAYVGLDASTGGENIRVQNLTLANTGTALTSEWINAKLIDVATGLQVGQTVQPAANVITFTFSGDELLVMRDEQVTLALQIDILSTATPGGTLMFDITALAGTGKASSTPATVAGVAGVANSPTQILVATGKLKVSLDADTAIAAQLVSSSTGNSAVSYKLEAIDENIEVKDIVIVGADPTAAAAAVPATFGSDILSVEAYLDGVKVGSTLSASGTGIHLLSLTDPIVVEKDVTMVLTLKVSVQTKANVTSGTRFVIGIANNTGVGTYGDGTGFGTTWQGYAGAAADGYGINATGQDSGTVIASATINTTGAAGGLVYGGNQMSSHDGVLTVSLNSSTPQGLAVAATNQQLMRVNLTATGDTITVNAIDFNTSTTCVFAGQTTLTYLKSADGAVTYGSDVILAAGAADFGISTPWASVLSISAGTTKVVKIEGDTSGCANPKTIQLQLFNGPNTANGVAWQASDAIAIGANAWAGPATKDLPLTGGAISY